MAKVTGGASQALTLYSLQFCWSHTGNLFVTKWVHIQRHGLKLGGNFSKLRSASFSFPEIPEINKRVPHIQGRVTFGKKEPLLGSLHTVVRIWGKNKISKSQGPLGGANKWRLTLASKLMKNIINKVNWKKVLRNTSLRQQNMSWSHTWISHHSIIGLFISWISGNEKDADRDLDKFTPSFSPYGLIWTHLVTKRFPVPGIQNTI